MNSVPDHDDLEKTPLIPCRETANRPGPLPPCPQPGQLMVQRRVHVSWYCELPALCRLSPTGQDGVCPV
jgi:hypothetical protein